MTKQWSDEDKPDVLECNSCGHQFHAHRDFRSDRVCPKCKSGDVFSAFPDAAHEQTVPHPDPDPEYD